MEAAAKRQYRSLPLVTNPFKHGDQEQKREHTDRTSGRCSSAEKAELIHGPDTNRPAFCEREEARSIELFYDLFFVANLTSFTSVHPIDDKQTLSSYIGFFAILWFTWLQVVLFDVRFGTDSIFERTAKLIHFGVMTTFAIVGTKFDPTKRGGMHVTIKQMSLILIVSRVVLICQYVSVMLWAKGQRKIATPLGIHLAAFATGAILCLGFFFTFTPESTGLGYIVWYVIIVVEALTVLLVSSRWPSISFQHTNLSERCGLLTLIILGEGIIVLTKSMNYIVQGENFSKGIIAQIISAVLIIYSVYMLYFDQTSRVAPSATLHHLWALAHFPFHIALVLLMEGTSRFITWRNALEIVNHILDHYSNIWDQSTTSTTVLARQLGNFSNDILKQVDADPVKYNVTGYLTELRNASDINGDEAYNAILKVVLVLVNATLKFFKIEAAPNSTGPQSHARASTLSGPPGAGEDPYEDLWAALQVYDLVFGYFFVAAGLTLVLMAVLMALNKKGSKYYKGDWAAMGVRGVVGSGIALVAVVKQDYTSEERFMYSPWMVPTVMLGIGLVVLLDGIVGWVMPAAAETREEKGPGVKSIVVTLETAS
ncbi:MAG: hypothetical protein Q9207_004914 [Kuettlingeria erythrocarpa]